MRQALVGKEVREIESLLVEHGVEAYRGRQLYHGIYRRRWMDWEQAAVLPARLRSVLERDFDFGLPAVSERVEAADGTVRYLLKLADRKTVEAVFIPESDRDTLCISSQVGCPVDCKFCLTALMGLERHLTAGEIVGQTLTLMREHGLDPSTRPVNVVMMGMGEPLLNLDNVMRSVRLMADPNGLAISVKRITVSTAGIVPQIDELGRREIRPKLAVSLNASNEEQRRALMPITKKYHLADLMDACRRYPLRAWERLTFEYVVLAGVNDSDADARRLVGLLGEMRAKVNLIALNPGPGIPFETPAPERVAAFQAIVKRSLPCFVRQPRGREIYAACGQLKRTVK